MNNNRKKSAIQKYGDQIKANPDGAKLAMQQADKPFSPEEIAEIFEAVKGDSSINLNTNLHVATKSAPQLEHDGHNPADPNAQFRDKLKELDYEHLNDENNDSFKKYIAIVNTLVHGRSYDFEQYMAYAEKESYFDKKLRAQEKIVGIVINKSTPVNKSRMPAQYANDLNSQIWNSNSADQNSRYWLLKKD